MSNWRKPSGDTEDFWFDWGSDAITDPTKRWLPADENITAATVDVPDGLVSEDEDFTDKVVRVRLSGGEVAKKFALKCTITTNKGQIFTIGKTLEIKERIYT